MRSDRLPRFVPLVAAIVAMAALPCSAQIASPRDAYPDKYPGPLPKRDGPRPPKVVFGKVVETAVPGPALPDTLVLEDGRLILVVETGPVSIATDPAAAAGPLPEPDRASPAPPDPWVVSADGRRRYRSDSSGWVVADKRRNPERRWRTAWRLRLPGASDAAPLLLGRRLVFGARDNQVYCVRADNGHRVWSRDLGERLSRPLVPWRGVLAVAGETGVVAGPHVFELILVVPDSGSSVVALDSYDGGTVGAISLTRDEGWFVSAPIILDDGRVAIVRQGYAPSDAAVDFYDLKVPASEDTSAGAPGYNAAPLAPPTSFSRR